MIRTRVAPSPTGYMHIGTAQSALYNWLFASKNNGQFLLRIEDTDRERSTKEYQEAIFSSLEWLGLKWNEEPVIQSKNLPRHKEMLDKLLKEGKAFYCHHTKEELETERKNQETNKQAPIHVCSYKKDSKGKENGGIIRLAVNENSERIISFNDHIRGEVEFKESLLGDFSIARAVDDPLYHFAVTVDDVDMKITHVLRGEDHISNTPKQLLIYEALGKEPPFFGHLPLILAPDRSKLSKRHGAVSVIDYKKDYLPEAIVNFLGSLSYTFSKEIISKEEMVKEFELEKVHKSGAVFDVKKLNWINSQYIKHLNIKKFKQLTNLPELRDEAIPLITERLEKLTDVQDFDYFWKKPSFAKASEGRAEYMSIELLKWKKASLEDSLKALNEVEDIIEKINFKEEILRAELDKLGEKLGDMGLADWPF